MNVKLRMTVLISLLVSLSGCATMMTDEQHRMFAQDNLMLSVCDDFQMMDPGLTSEALQLYRHRLNAHKADANKLNQEYNAHFEKIKNISLQDLSRSCRSYARKVQSEIIDHHKTMQSLESFNQLMQNISASSQEQMRSNTNTLLKLAELNNTQPKIQPLSINSIYPTNTVCRRSLTGNTINCQTR